VTNEASDLSEIGVEGKICLLHLQNNTKKEAAILFETLVSI